MTPNLVTRQFRSPSRSKADVGWWRPVFAVLLGLFIPALLAMLILYVEAPTLAGLSKDGTGFTIGDHAEMFIAAVSASVVVSWLIAPVAVVLLRYSAIFGWAGWGSAILSAWIIGLPTVHFALNADVTTEDSTILPHIAAAIALLSLSVWGFFLLLMRARRKSPNIARKK